MSKDTIDALASKASVATGASTTTMALVAIMGWQNLQGIERKLDAHMVQTAIMIQKLEQRIEMIERRLGEIYTAPRFETGKARQ
jgi:hypothetical protein